MSKGAFPTQSYLGNFGNYNLPPMAFTNTFMPPKPNYQPLMQTPNIQTPRQDFMSIQQQGSIGRPPLPVQRPMQPTPQLPPIEPMVTPTQPLTTTPQPLAQAPSLLGVEDRVVSPQERFRDVNKRGYLPPINLFR